MDEEFFRRLAVIVLVRADDHLHQLRRLILVEVEGVARLRVPRPHGSPEDEPVSGPKKHLRATARVVASAGPIDPLEDQAHVADAVAQVDETPRTAADLVEAGGRQIPGDGRGILHPRLGLLGRRIERNLLDNLNDLAGIHHARLELVVEVQFVFVDGRRLHFLRKHRTSGQDGAGRLHPELARAGRAELHWDDRLGRPYL